MTWRHRIASYVPNCSQIPVLLDGSCYPVGKERASKVEVKTTQQALQKSASLLRKSAEFMICLGGT